MTEIHPDQLALDECILVLNADDVGLLTSALCCFALSVQNRMHEGVARSRQIERTQRLGAKLDNAARALR